MSSGKIVHLTDRGAVTVTGPDALKFLQGLVTNDLSHLSDGAAVHAGLLSPQGKILFAFFVIRTPEGFVLDVARDRAADLIKRLNTYKLRASVALTDRSDETQVYALWDGARLSDFESADTALLFPDPRSPEMGVRVMTLGGANVEPNASPADYHAQRVALGIPEGARDYEFGEAYPHEANFDLLHGASFTKGCYVGQEIVSRMQNKAVVRKRVIKISGENDLTSGDDVMIGETAIGRVGTVDGRQGLALVRLDRALEAHDTGSVLKTQSGVPVTADAAALTLYREAAAARPHAPEPKTTETGA